MEAGALGGCIRVQELHHIPDIRKYAIYISDKDLSTSVSLEYERCRDDRAVVEYLKCKLGVWGSLRNSCNSHSICPGIKSNYQKILALEEWGLGPCSFSNLALALKHLMNFFKKKVDDRARKLSRAQY